MPTHPTSTARLAALKESVADAVAPARRGSRGGRRHRPRPAQRRARLACAARRPLARLAARVRGIHRSAVVRRALAAAGSGRRRAGPRSCGEEQRRRVHAGGADRRHRARGRCARRTRAAAAHHARAARPADQSRASGRHHRRRAARAPRRLRPRGALRLLRSLSHAFAPCPPRASLGATAAVAQPAPARTGSPPPCPTSRRRPRKRRRSRSNGRGKWLDLTTSSPDELASPAFIANEFGHPREIVKNAPYTAEAVTESIQVLP